MLYHVGMLGKCLLAAGTLVRLQTCFNESKKFTVNTRKWRNIPLDLPLCTKLWRCKFANCVNALLQIELMGKKDFTGLAGWCTGEEMARILPHKGAFARVCLGVLPHAALARKMLSTQFALVLAFGQVLRLVGYHLLVGIEALCARGKRDEKWKWKLCVETGWVGGGGVSFSHEVEGWTAKKNFQHVHKS